MWAMRITHECTLHENSNGNSFITLTYRDKTACTKSQKENKEHIPEDWSLSIQHFQKFMKRLRKSKPGAKLKFYHCGEYGSTCKHGINLDLTKCPLCNVGRPHYHAILFNCTFDDLEPYAIQNDITRMTSPTLEQTWKHGFVDVGNVTFQSAAYVARYIMKKVNGVNADDHYSSTDYNGEITNLQHEYSTMSNGIGLDWYEKYKTDCFPSDEVPVPGEGIIKKVPRYYEERLKNENEEMHTEVKRLRQQFRKDNADEYTPERLISKYKVKKAQVNLLGRKL